MERTLITQATILIGMSWLCFAVIGYMVGEIVGEAKRIYSEGEGGEDQ